MCFILSHLALTVFPFWPFDSGWPWLSIGRKTSPNKHYMCIILNWLHFRYLIFHKLYPSLFHFNWLVVSLFVFFCSVNQQDFFCFLIFFFQVKSTCMFIFHILMHSDTFVGDFNIFNIRRRRTNMMVVSQIRAAWV